MMHKAWSSIEEVPYCFSRSYVKLQGHTAKKNRRFWPNLSVTGLWLQFEFTNGYEMMHNAWNNIEEVPYCFSRLYVKLQGHTAKKNVDFWGVVHQISRSHGLKNRRFESNLSKITRPVAAIKSLRFALLFFHNFPHWDYTSPSQITSIMEDTY